MLLQSLAIVMICVCKYLYNVSMYFQSVIFHVERHPVFTWFEQCVTFNFFPTPAHELAYNLFNLITVYLLPLIIITASYSGILYTISKNARRAKGTLQYIGKHISDVIFMNTFFPEDLVMEISLPLIQEEQLSINGKRMYAKYW